MHRKERSYSVDLGEQENKERTRQFSRRTLNDEKSSEGLMSVDLETQKDHSINSKTVKTVKLNIAVSKTEQ